MDPRAHWQSIIREGKLWVVVALLLFVAQHYYSLHEFMQPHDVLFLGYSPPKQEEEQFRPLISVIIPVSERKQREAVVQAIESALYQTYPNVEVIIVDVSRGRTSNRTVLNWLMDDDMPDDARNKRGHPHPLKVILPRLNHPTETDTYAGYARNFGVHHSNGEYLAFLDADDAYLPSKLEDHVKFFHQHREWMVVDHHDQNDKNDKDVATLATALEFSGTEGYWANKCRYDAKTNVTTQWDLSAPRKHQNSFSLYNGERFRKVLGKIAKRKHYPLRDGANLPLLWDLESIEWHNCAIASTILLSRRLFDLVGGFNETMAREQDWDMWKRVLGHPQGPNYLGYFPKPLTAYDGACHGTW